MKKSTTFPGHRNPPKPPKNKGYEVQNLRSRAMNAERMVQKLTDERAIIQASSVIKNYLIAGLVIGLILSLIF